VTVVATAGHVDHGKSSLVRALTGTDPDRLAEEKRRGMTIELGFAHTVTPDGTELSFVDVPGHADLVRTMIAGTGAVGAVLLVIDAREGWMPQTLEHLAIAELLGTPAGLVALTKCDLVDASRIAELTAHTAERLARSSIDWSVILPVSALTGAGIEELRNALVALVAQSAQLPTGGNMNRPRLFVDRVFSRPGAGTVVTGTLEHGALRTGEELSVVRTGARSRVRSLQRHGHGIELCPADERCAVNLGDLDTDDLVRGDALVMIGQWHCTTVFDARLAVVQDSGTEVKPGAGHLVHFGTDRQSASLRPLAGDGLWRIRVERSWPMSPGDRFIVRRTGDGTTIAGGVVLDVAPVRRPSLARPDGTVESQLADHGFVDPDTARRITGTDVATVAGRWCAAASTIGAARADLERLLDAGQVPVGELAPWQRDLLATMDDVVVEIGVARRGADPLGHHPVATAIREGGLTGPGTGSLDRDVVRRLVAAGLVFEHDGIAFHRDTLEQLRGVLGDLLAASPAGFTVSSLRERLGITRKHAVPLAACLDRGGWTLRRGDLRIAGPRLSRTDQ